MNLDAVCSIHSHGHPVSTSFTDLETSILTFDEELREISRFPTKLIKRTITLEGIRARRNDLDILKNRIETMINRLDTIQGEYTLLLEELLEK